jgi:hypothetical protein
VIVQKTSRSIALEGDEPYDRPTEPLAARFAESCQPLSPGRFPVHSSSMMSLSFAVIAALGSSCLRDILSKFRLVVLYSP